MSESPGKTSRLAWLDALRGFAALCVVFDHGSTLLLLPVRDFLYRWLDLGEYGVFVFFLVSGYIVPASLERRGSLRAFWTGRAFRLYPMFTVALVLSMVAYLTGFGTIRGAEHDPASSVAAWLLMLQNMLTGPNVPNVAWTLSYEMVFYLLLAALFSFGAHRRSGGYAVSLAVGAVALGGVLPMAAFAHWAGTSGGRALALNLTADALVIAGIAVSVLARRSMAVRIGACVAALTALLLATVNQSYPYPWSSCTILALMFTGTVIYRAGQRQLSWGVALAVVAVVLALTVSAGLVWHANDPRHDPQWGTQWATSLLLAAATFGIGLAARRRRVPRLAAWLGVISYSVYLLHPLVFDAYRSVPALHRRHPMTGQILLFAGLLAVIITVSAISYYLVEKPMQNFGRWVAARFAPGGQDARASAAYPAGVSPPAAAVRSASSSNAVAGGSGGSP